MEPRIEHGYQSDNDRSLSFDVVSSDIVQLLHSEFKVQHEVFFELGVAISTGAIWER
jgi:hypothetical protein